MIDEGKATRACLKVLGRAAPGTIRALRKELGLSRTAAAEAYAATAALCAAGLARLTRRRPNDARAAVEAVKEHGRRADVDAPALGLRGRLEKPRLSPRVAGILGEGGPRAAAWLAERTGADEEVLTRAIAATAPIALGAFEVALEPRELGDWIAMLPDHALTRVEHLLEPNEVPAEIFRRLRRFALPRPMRLLGLSG
jgi:hypothetical protein